MRELIIVMAVGLGTYLMRASFVALLGSRQLSESVIRVLDHAKHAVLAALVVGFLSSGHAEPTVAAVGLVAAAVAALAVKRPLAPLAVGLGVAFAFASLAL